MDHAHSLSWTPVSAGPAPPPALVEEAKPTKIRSCATCRTRKIKCSQDRPMCRCCAKLAEQHGLEGASCIYYDLENEVDLAEQLARCFVVAVAPSERAQPDSEEAARRARKRQKQKQKAGAGRRKKVARKLPPPRQARPKTESTPAADSKLDWRAPLLPESARDFDVFGSYRSPLSPSTPLGGSPLSVLDSLSPSPSPLELATPRELYPDLMTDPFESLYLGQGTYKKHSLKSSRLDSGDTYGLGLQGVGPAVGSLGGGFWEGGPLGADELSGWEGLKMEHNKAFVGGW